MKLYKRSVVLKHLYSTHTFVFLGLATALHVFCIYGITNWVPSFLTRTHHMQSADIGVALGLLFGIGGAIGTFTGGYLTDHLGKKDKRWYLWIPAMGAGLASVFTFGGLFVEHSSASLAYLGLCVTMQSVYLGPSIAVAHSLVPASMRALTSAILFFILNLIGLGLGPLVVGYISDWLAPSLQAESLRWAMSVVVVVDITAAALFFVTAGKYQLDIQ